MIRKADLSPLGALPIPSKAGQIDRYKSAVVAVSARPSSAPPPPPVECEYASAMHDLAGYTNFWVLGVVGSGI